MDDKSEIWASVPTTITVMIACSASELVISTG